MFENTIFYTLAQLRGAHGLPNPDTSNVLETVLKTSFVIIGALAVIFVIIGGFQYVLSGGNPNNTSRAKETIIYAIVGLVVSLLAFSIVDFVVGKV